MRLYNRTQVVVSPSLYEGFGLPAVEAMACGVPVVATRAGALSEIIEDGVTGILVPPADSGALSEALRLLLSDPELCRRMGRGRPRARAEELHLAPHRRADGAGLRRGASRGGAERTGMKVCFLLHQGKMHSGGQGVYLYNVTKEVAAPRPRGARHRRAAVSGGRCRHHHRPHPELQPVRRARNRRPGVLPRPPSARVLPPAQLLRAGHDRATACSPSCRRSACAPSTVCGSFSPSAASTSSTTCRRSATACC